MPTSLLIKNLKIKQTQNDSDIKLNIKVGFSSVTSPCSSDMRPQGWTSHHLVFACQTGRAAGCFVLCSFSSPRFVSDSRALALCARATCRLRGVTLRQGQTGHLGLICNMPGLGKSLLWPLRAQCWPWLCHEQHAKVRAQILSHCFGTVCTDYSDYSPFCIILALAVCARKRGKEERAWQHDCNRGRKLSFYLWWLWYQLRMAGHEQQTFQSCSHLYNTADCLTTAPQTASSGDMFKESFSEEF